MNKNQAENKAVKVKRYVFSTLFSGLGMWIIGGLYHNLIIPKLNDNIHAHHEGLVQALLAYFILAFLMTYIFTNSKEKNSLVKGIKIGCLIGILWVFPHGLTMAGIHDTSIVYEIKNTLYHIVEQGIGGILVFYISSYVSGSKTNI